MNDHLTNKWAKTAKSLSPLQFFGVLFLFFSLVLSIPAHMSLLDSESGEPVVPTQAKRLQPDPPLPGVPLCVGSLVSLNVRAASGSLIISARKAPLANTSFRASLVEGWTAKGEFILRTHAGDNCKCVVF